MSDNLARVIPLRRITPESLADDLPRAPRRRPRNGHHADCPYLKTDPKSCGICASMRKGRDL